jgi:hypothetical protein
MNTPATTATAFSNLLRASWRQWVQMDAPAAGPRWLALVCTALFSAVLAVGFTVLGFVMFAHHVSDWLAPANWALWYGRNLVVSLIIGFVIHGLFALARIAIGPGCLGAMTDGLRAVFCVAVTMLGVAIGWPAGIAVINGSVGVLAGVTPLHVVGMLAMSLLTSTLVYLYFELRNREIRADARAAEARMRLLHGQMEPHFLFNTLANVISLIDADPPRARAVLEEFTDYLRVSLGSLRSGQSTLGAELELASRFLHIMQARMGERLRFEIEAAPELRHAALPSLLLQPLVENAVKHGLEPQVEGGLVRVLAERLDDRGHALLRLCVEDDGAGLEGRGARHPTSAAAGAGMALANLRERLEAVYGGAAQLSLAPRPGGAGSRVCLVVPLRAASPPQAEAATALPEAARPAFTPPSRP